AAFASPMADASRPVIVLPVSTSSAARFWPTAAASATAATGGKHPSLISGKPQLESGAAYTMSHTSASSAAPPMHLPCTAAIVTLLVVFSRLISSCNDRNFQEYLSVDCMSQMPSYE